MKVEWGKALFISSLILSIILRFSLLNVNKGLWWDEAVYLSLGRNILNKKYYIDVIASDKESFRSPFLPLISAFSLLIDKEIVARLIVLLFSITGMITTYYLGKTLFDRKTGYLAATLLSSFPLYIFFGQMILSESIFVTFFSLSLLTFYLGIEKEKKYLYYCGFLTGLSFLTKYFALIIPVLYILYILLRRKEKILLKKETWVSIGIFLLTISPWFILGIEYYNNPIGGMIKNIEVYSQAFVQPLNFFFLNIYRIFGYCVVLIPISLYFLLKDRKPQHVLIVISIILPFLYFSLSPHKEMRYLVSFSSVYAIGIVYAIRRMKKYETLTISLLIFFIIQGYFLGYQTIKENEDVGLALKEGSLFLKEITSPDEYVMSESYPYITYYSERIAVRIPKDKKTFYSLIEEYNIKYIFINVNEPGNPDYFLNELRTKNFEEVKSFTHIEMIVIYKKL